MNRERRDDVSIHRFVDPSIHRFIDGIPMTGEFSSYQAVFGVPTCPICGLERLRYPEILAKQIEAHEREEQAGEGNYMIYDGFYSRGSEASPCCRSRHACSSRTR